MVGDDDGIKCGADYYDRLLRAASAFRLRLTLGFS
jgi:hypothetical protein